VRHNTTIDRNLTYLVPERIVTSDGTGPEVDLHLDQGKLLVATLGIECVAEHESLLVSIWGSRDGSDWGLKPLVSFPPKYYCGLYSRLLNLASFPEIRYLKVVWKLRRNARRTRPMEFAFYVLAEESGSRVSSAVA